MNYKIDVYSASWCPNCSVLKNSLDEANIQYEVVDCDSDEGMSRAAALGIRGLPTTVISQDGTVIRRIVGLQPVSQYAPYANAVIENYEEVPALNG
jgi:thioredoxin-like negative regulator of GroEL